MKIKAKWGFIGNAVLLKADGPAVRAGQIFPDVDDEYAHTLIGKGLAEEVKAESGTSTSKPAPKATKPAAPAETK